MELKCKQLLENLASQEVTKIKIVFQGGEETIWIEEINLLETCELQSEIQLDEEQKETLENLALSYLNNDWQQKLLFNGAVVINLNCNALKVNITFPDFINKP